MKNRPHDVAAARNLVVRGNHDVLADWKIAERPAHLYGGPAFVRHVIHHDEEVYVTRSLASPRAREPKSTTLDGLNRPTMRSTMTKTTDSEVIL